LLRLHEVVAVVTQPDRPAHRGRRLTPPPVKVRALAAGLPVVQPARLRDPEWPGRLAEFRPDVAVVVAFGQILPKAVLQVPGRRSAPGSSWTRWRASTRSRRRRSATTRRRSRHDSRRPTAISTSRDLRARSSI